MFRSVFSDRKFYKTLVVLALPILVQNFLASSLNMVDTLMIGRVGEDEVAAVGVANQLFFLFNLVANGAAAGCSIFISQYWGQRDIPRIRRVVGFGLVVNCAIGLLFTFAALTLPHLLIQLFSRDERVIALGVDYLLVVCLSYLFSGVSFLLAGTLRSVGYAYQPMLVSLFAILINIVFNYLMIFGHGGFPAMGVRGAALATLIARIVETLLLIAFSFRRRSPFAGPVREFFRFGRDFTRKVVGAMLPVVVNEGCWALGTVLYTVAYGFIGDGTKAIAASQIVNSVQNLFMIFCFSTASSALVMIGHQIGAGDRENAIAYSRRFTALAVLLGVILGVVVLSAAPFILSFFKVSEEARLSAIGMLRVFSVIAPARVLNIVLIVGVFRGGGDTSFGLKVEAGTMWLIGVPMAFLGALVFRLPVEGVVALITAEEVVKCILSCIRLKQNKWVRDLTT